MKSSKIILSEVPNISCYFNRRIEEAKISQNDNKSPYLELCDLNVKNIKMILYIGKNLNIHFLNNVH